MWLTAAFILLLSFLFLKQIITFKKYNLDAFPEPAGLRFFGHIFIISCTEEILTKTSQLMNDYGKTIKLRFGPSLWPITQAIFSADYKFIEMVLRNNHFLTKAENYPFLKDWLGNGLLLSDGNYWRRHRKILTPAFHFVILKEFVEIFERTGDILIEKLTLYNDASSVDLHPLVTLYTLDVICESAMGTKLNVQNGENVVYVQSVKDMCRIIMERCFSPIQLLNSTFWLSKSYYNQKKAVKILHNFTSDVITSKKRQQSTKTTKRMFFLDLLLKYSQNGVLFTDKEIQEEVDTFMFEGHDTTAAGICFTLYCLADNLDVQAKILQEQKNLFDNEKNPKITYSELQKMKYLECVIKESLRLFPPIPLIGRFTTEDIKLGPYLIPKNVNILLSFYKLHRDPEYFPEPEKFKPERFENFDDSLPYTYVPFSAGSRNCIGQKFAMLEMKSTISKVVRHFEIRPAFPRHELKLSAETVLKSMNGVKVSLRRRS